MLDVTRAYDLDLLFPAQDHIIGAALRAFGEFARPEVDLIDRLLQSSDGGLLDVGANIGAIALPIAARHPTRQVVAVEANRRIANILAANALTNRLANVEVLHAAAGAAAGIASFPMPPLNLSMNYGELGFAQEGDLHHENVRVCTLDEVASGSTCAVKLDVEGFELEVMKGAQRLLTQHRPAWVFEWKDGPYSREMVRLFLGSSYNLYWLFTPYVSISSLKRPGISTSLDGDTNVVALPDGRAPPMDMVPIVSAEDMRPGNVAGYPYLRDYGFS